MFVFSKKVDSSLTLAYYFFVCNTSRYNKTLALPPGFCCTYMLLHRPLDRKNLTNPRIIIPRQAAYRS